MELIGKYKNGNFTTAIYSDGTKVRYNNEDVMIPDTIESLDIKITNRCDMGCIMCHEDSKKDGKHADLFSPSFIDELHPYTELAIGGGNPLEHPDLYEFLKKCKTLKFIPSMTINQYHFEKHYDFIKKLVDEKLIYGLGISFNGTTSNYFLDKVAEFPNAVIHTIAGLTKLEDYKKLANKGLKVLILGFKKFRRGEKLYQEHNTAIDEQIGLLRSKLKDVVNEHWFEVLSFDNLALDQLDVKSLMTEAQWNQFYMGDDGIGDDFDSATMYVDMVERKFAKNSCAVERFDLLPTIEEMYNFLREENDRKRKKQN